MVPCHGASALVVWAWPVIHAAERAASLLAHHLLTVAGIIAIYAVVQTHFEYLAQHMFLLNRIQQAVMHDLGPVLVALAWPGAVICRGMPRFLRGWRTGH